MIELTRDEVLAKIEELYQKYPMLRDYEPESWRCPCCGTNDIGARFGWDAADAWDEIQTYRWLMGDGA